MPARVWTVTIRERPGETSNNEEARLAARTRTSVEAGAGQGRDTGLCVREGEAFGRWSDASRGRPPTPWKQGPELGERRAGTPTLLPRECR